MKKSLILGCAAAVLGLALNAQTAAQKSLPPVTPAGSAFGASGFHVDRVIVGVGSDEKIGAMGGAYKASFTDGLEFTPYFGPGAATNLPIRFQTARITAGGVEIPVSTASAALQGERVILKRGAVEEVYAPSIDGVEQLFVIAAPMGAGAIAIDVHVDSAFTASMDADGIRFAHELGLVRYGKATLIDASGKTAPVAESFANGTITLTAAASALEGMTYPITIDPLITVINPFPSNNYPVVSTDVAFLKATDGSDHWLSVIETEFTSTDHDVFCVRIDAAGVAHPAALAVNDTVDFSNNDWRQPSVGSSGPGQRYFVAAIRKLVAQSQNEVVGRMVRLAEAVDPVYAYTAAPGAYSNPCVGGDPYDICLMVVYESAYSATDHDIFATRLFFSGAWSSAYDSRTIDYSTSNMINPRISKSNGNAYGHTGDWLVVWEVANVVGDHDIMGVYFDAYGTQGSSFVINSSGLDTTNPSVSSPSEGFPVRFAVAFERSGVAGSSDIGVHLLEGQTSIAGFLSLFAVQGVPQTYNRKTPMIESNGCALTLLDRTFGSGTIVLGGAGLEATTFLMSASGLTLFPEPTVPLAGSFAFAGDPSIASSWSGNATTHKMMYGWTSGAVLGQTSANAALYDLPLGMSQVTRVATETDDLDIELYGAASPGQSISAALCCSGPFAVMIVGVPGPVTNYYGLPIGVDLNLSPIIVNGPFFSMTLPMNANLIGFTFAVQGADQSGTGFLGYRVSDTLNVTIQ